MRTEKILLINNQAVHFVDDVMVLELNNAGRGYVTVESEKSLLGQQVEFKLGTSEGVYQWFEGFVEAESPAQNGYRRLFIREYSALFEREISYSARHPTLEDVCDFLKNKVGVAFRCPDKPYSKTPIPNFTHNGSGFQLLNNLGRLFSIGDFIWQQEADGAIFVGAWADSQWADNKKELDSQLTQAQSANGLEIAIDAEIRPGMLVNGKRIVKVKMQNESYVLEWDNLDKNGKALQKSPQRRAMEKEFPELAGGYHLPKMAKVIGIADPSQAGDVSDPFRPKYAVDVQLISDNQEGGGVPIYSAVPLPVTSTASQGGDFAFPEVGTMVEIGFIDGRADKPFVRSLFAQGKTLPDVQPGEMLRQQRPEVFERTDSAGNMHKETDQAINEKSYTRNIKATTENKDIGQAIKNVEGSAETTIGGKKTTHVLGNNESLTAGNVTQGVGGDLNQRIKGAASMIAKGKLEQMGATIWTGSEEVNAWAVMDELLGIVQSLAQTVAGHSHNGSPAPDQAGQFNKLANKTAAEKGKLSPIVG